MAAPLAQGRRQPLKGHGRQRERVAVALDLDHRFGGHGSDRLDEIDEVNCKRVNPSIWFADAGAVAGRRPVGHSGESCSSCGTGGLSCSTLPVGQPGPEGFFSQPRMGRTMFSAAIGVPL